MQKVEDVGTVEVGFCYNKGINPRFFLYDNRFLVFFAIFVMIYNLKLSKPISLTLF